MCKTSSIYFCIHFQCFSFFLVTPIHCNHTLEQFGTFVCDSLIPRLLTVVSGLGMRLYICTCVHSKTSGLQRRLTPRSKLNVCYT